MTVFITDRRQNKGPKYSAAIASENQKSLKLVSLWTVCTQQWSSQCPRSLAHTIKVLHIHVCMCVYMYILYMYMYI